MRAHSLMVGASQELRALEAELAETVEKERAIRAEIPDLKRQFDEIKAKIENRLAIVATTSQQTNELVQKIELSEKRITGLCIR
jgi:peptidoglycan hydrolase CwlO-like protein